MSDAATSDAAPAKRGLGRLLLPVALAVAGAGGGYYAVASGLVPLSGLAAGKAGKAGKHHPTGHENDAGAAAPDAFDPPVPPVDTAFVPVDPIMISLDGGATARHLRFRAQLEVGAAHKPEVEALLPRVIDVLNGYLRALELADLRDPAALVRLRAQMLRRVQVVTGGDRVRDLLIMEFVLN